MAAAAPTPDQTRILLAYLQLQSTQQRYADAIGSLLDARKAQQSARAVLSQFVMDCTRNTPGVAALPKRLALNLKKRIVLPTVDNQPEFFATTYTELQTIEQEASQRIFEAVRKAREKHLAHLTNLANPLTFLDTATATYRTYVTAYAADIDQRYGRSGYFPVDAACSHFHADLQQRIDKSMLQSVEADRDDEERKQAAAAAENAAAEKVLHGASSSETLTRLARRVAADEVDRRLQGSRVSVTSSAPTSSHKRRHVSPHPSSSLAGHAPSNAKRAHITSHPKNVQGGDRWKSKPHRLH
jgi:hypothetical protein